MRKGKREQVKKTKNKNFSCTDNNEADRKGREERLMTRRIMRREKGELGD